MTSARVAVITGASRGLGLVLASEFAANGWLVIGTGRSEQPADFPTNASYRRFDAGDAAAGDNFWRQVHDDYPDAEVCLVNNAGGYVGGSLTETKPEDFEQQMRSAYFAAVYMTRGLALVYASARIINVISSSALAAHKNNSAYGAAKAAEMHFFQSLQQEFKPDQYQTTNLYPSDIASHGPNPKAIDPKDLAAYIRNLAESQDSIYLRDVTMHPRTREK
jgi:NAD(P)-dependent dehydrogenase (short-subunit alcohol dehydrogenase family)